MKIFKIKNRPFLVLLIFSIFIVAVLFFSKNLETNNRPYSIDTIDGLTLGDLASNSISVVKSDKSFITEITGRKKEYDNIFKQIKEFYLLLTIDKGENISLTNPLSSKLKFSLVKTITDETNLQAVYDAKKKQLNFVIPEERFSLNNEFLSRSAILYSLNDISNDSILKINNSVIDVQKYNDDFYLSKKELDHGGFELLKQSDLNLLDTKAANFDDGLWTDGVYDCSDKLPEQPEIFMALDEGKNNSLILASKNHYACTSKYFFIKFEKDKFYKFSFDYKNIKGGKVQYSYYLSEAGQKPIFYTEAITATNNDWNNYSNFIKPVSNFSSFQIFLYAPSDGSQEVINLYGNLKVEEYKLDQKLMLTSAVDFERGITIADGIELTEGKNEFKYVAEDKNLLDYQEASFENGLWTKKTYDYCDQKEGEARIAIALSGDAAAGKNSLFLSAQNHCAGSNKTFPVFLANNMFYRFSFDYKSLKGGKIQYYYTFRNRDNLSERGSEIIEVNNTDWNHFEKIIDLKITDVVFFDIYFYASADGKTEIENLYDNVRLEEYMPKDLNSYFLFSSQKVDEVARPETIEYKTVNYFKNLVVLHNVNKSFLLAYPGKYSPNLKVYPYYDDKYLSPEDNNLATPEKYFVSESEYARQASKEEINTFIANSSISATGSKFISKSFDGSIRNDNLENPSVLISYLNPALTEGIHYRINNYSNAWWIDLDDLCLTKNLCHENSDGTFDISLVIESEFSKILDIIIICCGIIGAISIGLIVWAGLKTKKV